MTAHLDIVIPRPDAHPAKNVRRAGVPNHHLNGSGETLMVGNNAQVRPVPGLSDEDYEDLVMCNCPALPRGHCASQCRGLFRTAGQGGGFGA